MRRSEKQITDPKEIEAILRSGRVCFLCMVDDGKPYVVPLNFGYDKGSLYFHSAPEGRKIDILRKNSDVCFSIVARHNLVRSEKACSWTAEYSSVTGNGHAAILTDEEAIRSGLNILMGQYSEEGYEFNREDLDGVVIIRVEILEMTGKSNGAGG